MLGLKLIHVSQRGYWSLELFEFKTVFFLTFRCNFRFQPFDYRLTKVQEYGVYDMVNDKLDLRDDTNRSGKGLSESITRGR